MNKEQIQAQRRQMLHNHPKMECELGVDSDHVIIDKTESRTSWVGERLDTLFNHRMDHGLSLVVTTNLGLDEIPPRISSRLKRHTSSKRVFIDAVEYSEWVRR